MTRQGIAVGASKTGVLLEFIDSDLGWMEPRDVTVEQAIRIIQKFDGFRGVAVALADGSIETIFPKAIAECFR